MKTSEENRMDKNVKEKIQRLISKYPDRNNSDINEGLSRKDRVGAAAIAKVRAEMGGGVMSANEKKKGRSLSDFRMTYDKSTIIPSKIKTALKELGASWEYEREFVTRANVTYADLSNFRDEFAEHCIVIRAENKRIWAGTISFAKELRQMI